jgi:hypothetical protein
MKSVLSCTCSQCICLSLIIKEVQVYPEKYFKILSKLSAFTIDKRKKYKYSIQKLHERIIFCRKSTPTMIIPFHREGPLPFTVELFLPGFFSPNSADLF